jgi:hypothetical protein
LTLFDRSASDFGKAGGRSKKNLSKLATTGVFEYRFCWFWGRFQLKPDSKHPKKADFSRALKVRENPPDVEFSAGP